MRARWWCAAALAPAVAWAHPLAFGVVELAERGDGRVAVTMRVSGTEQQGSVVSLSPPAGCRAEAPLAMREVGDTWEGRTAWRCARGLRGAAMTVRGLEGSEVQLVVRTTLAGGEVIEARLDDHRRAFVVPRGARRWSVAWSYLRMGVRHIAEGVDHLAFVACLALWVGATRRVWWATTGFTLGHSVTLALAATGRVSVPARPVEACIALSVALLAWEVARGNDPPRSAWQMAAGFGLLHGLGFASALRDAGLPREAVGTALVTFNAGVEVGQVAFVALALGAAWLVKRAGVDAQRARGWAADLAGAWAVMLLLQRV